MIEPGPVSCQQVSLSYSSLRVENRSTPTVGSAGKAHMGPPLHCAALGGGTSTTTCHYRRAAVAALSSSVNVGLGKEEENTPQGNGLENVGWLR